ncbi:MAG: bifunctional heptose 7-phosphate kinase/heptose 1-phosphate adenyltransferase, partial [Synergistes sp.]|nr:bifunctional heptose 7-phosphate kinase/heptose 1-phosphate adenyltransferase [Synergistes sp.]
MAHKHKLCGINAALDVLSAGFPGTRIVVVGDFMLDRYIYGDVERISQEAPVPIVKIKSEKYVAGGAGNVAANLAGLGVGAFAVGNAGSDRYGERLISILSSMGVNTSAFTAFGSTTVKTRIMGSNSQQMIRLDEENILSLSVSYQETILANVKEALLCGADAIIISDYEKGFCSAKLCQSLIAAAKELGVPVWVDPKKDDWLAYRGASVVTPNLKELSAACGRKILNDDSVVTEAALTLMKRFSLGAVLATRSEKGATLVTEQNVSHIPSRAVEVYDVSGAGDTMIASTCAFCAAGIDIKTAVTLANTASQIVIGKAGTSPITANELFCALACRIGDMPTKILSQDTAAKLCEMWKGMGSRVIFTNGCFDILHTGHIDSLSFAKSLGDRLIVGLNSDASVKRLKGSDRPINCCEARAKVLAGLSVVDAVVIFEEDTP